ncbi:MAG: helix-hairpin-helix domain-containing protein [Prolixibacteraceae bacterium]|nr:helix-hairpin-helix domain-containing protein [Prolixibacteraceae bacterium]
MRIRQIIRKYFYFSRGEQKGILLLLVFIVLIFLANSFIFSFEKREGINVLLLKQDGYKNFTENKAKSNRSLFLFNPNLIDSLKLDSLNLPFYVKKNLLSYRRHNGVLKYKDDLLKIYGMNDSIYSRVKEYIVLSDKPIIVKNIKPVFPGVHKGEGENVTIVDEKRKLVEINSASAEDYKKLWGIGDVLSVRIVKYRNLLGGFYSKKQLLEVYGLSDETFKNIEKYLVVDTTKIVHINVNFSGFRELIFNPYLKKEDVKRIINYRDSVGFIKDKRQLLEFSVLEDSVYSKISHYLEVKTPESNHVNKADP